MRTLLLITIITVSSVYCANKDNLCPNNRNPQPCPEVYDPVCAIQNGDQGQVRVTMSNKCFACNDSKTEYIVEGSCETYPKDALFCDPKKSDLLCASLIIYPVCGYFDSSVLCTSPPCKKNFSNICMACVEENISFTVPGKCPLY